MANDLSPFPPDLTDSLLGAAFRVAGPQSTTPAVHSTPVPPVPCPECDGAGEIATGWTPATRMQPCEPSGLMTCPTCDGEREVTPKCAGCDDPAVRMDGADAVCAGCFAWREEEAGVEYRAGVAL